MSGSAPDMNWNLHSLQAIMNAADRQFIKDAQLNARNHVTFQNVERFFNHIWVHYCGMQAVLGRIRGFEEKLQALKSEYDKHKDALRTGTLPLTVRNVESFLEIAEKIYRLIDVTQAKLGYTYSRLDHNDRGLENVLQFNQKNVFSRTNDVQHKMVMEPETKEDDLDELLEPEPDV